MVHPDADQLTAFLEQALSQPERQHVMQHLSRCVNCRDAVALSMPELDLMPAAVAEPQASIWRRWLVFRWAAAAAAVVVVAGTVTLYQTNQRRNTVATIVDGPAYTASRQPKPAESTQTEVATRTEANETKPADRVKAEQPVMTAELRDRDTVSAKAAKEKAAPSKADETPTLMAKAQQPAAVPPPPVSAGAAAMSPNVSSPATVATLDRPVEVRGGVLTGAGASGFPPGSGRTLRPSEEPPLQSYDQPDRVFTTTAEARPQRSLSIGGRAAEAAKTLAKREPMAVGMFAAPPLPNAPSLNRRWIVTSAGELQRSHAIGEAFHPVHVADGIFFKAVAESGMEVWAGGVGGALYHSTDDGNSWMKLMPSAGDHPLFADITSIHATQRGAADLTTSNGEHWITVDGGQHWARHE
jgi:hypothetical protein